MSQQGIQPQWVVCFGSSYLTSSPHTPAWALGTITEHFRETVGMFSHPAVGPWPGWLTPGPGKRRDKEAWRTHPELLFSSPSFKQSYEPTSEDCSKEQLIKLTQSSVEKMCNSEVLDKRQNKSNPTMCLPSYLLRMCSSGPAYTDAPPFHCTLPLQRGSFWADTILITDTSTHQSQRPFGMFTPYYNPMALPLFLYHHKQCEWKGGCVANLTSSEGSKPDKLSDWK